MRNDASGFSTPTLFISHSVPHFALRIQAFQKLDQPYFDCASDSVAIESLAWQRSGREGMYEYLKPEYEARNAGTEMRNDKVGVEKPDRINFAFRISRFRI